MGDSTRRVTWLSELQLKRIDGCPWGSWELTEPFNCRYGADVLQAPKGMVTDFASIPRLGQIFYRRDADFIIKGSVIHDWLYTLNDLAWSYPKAWPRAYPRSYADRFLHDACRASGANWARANVIYSAVRLGGGRLWDRVPEDRIKDQRARLIAAGSWPAYEQ